MLAVVAALVAVPVLLVVFVLVERRLALAAMLDVRLFRIPTFTAAILLAFGARLTSFGLFPFLILWLTGVCGHSPFQVGLILLVLSATMLLVAPFSGKLTPAVPVALLNCIGMAVVGGGLVWGALTIGPDDGWTALLPVLIATGVGAGIVMPHMMGLALSVVPAARSGMASGMSNTFFPLGTAVGVAAYGALMTEAIASRVADPDLVEAVAAGRFSELAAALPAGSEAVLAQARQAYVEGLSDIMLIAGCASALVGVAVLFLIRPSDIHEPASEDSSEPDARP